jgi:hypothetical protein
VARCRRAPQVPRRLTRPPPRRRRPEAIYRAQIAPLAGPWSVEQREADPAVLTPLVLDFADAYRANLARAANVRAAARLQADVNPMPIDGKRLIYGGFEVVLDE